MFCLEKQQIFFLEKTHPAYMKNEIIFATAWKTDPRNLEKVLILEASIISLIAMVHKTLSGETLRLLCAVRNGEGKKSREGKWRGMRIICSPKVATLGVSELWERKQSAVQYLSLNYTTDLPRGAVMRVISCTFLQLQESKAKRLLGDLHERCMGSASSVPCSLAQKKEQDRDYLKIEKAAD